MKQAWTSWTARRFTLLCWLVLTTIPSLDHNSYDTTTSAPIDGTGRSQDGEVILPRGYNASNVCFRWAQQSAVVNGTLYLYGGQIKTQQGQTQNTWTNNFYSLDLTNNWQIAQPAMSQLAQPDGPPAVALGYLWSSHQSLFLYGGEFSWQPVTQPAPLATWEYHIQSQSWESHSNPQSSDGTNAPENNAAIQRAAEGAGVNVPALGRGYYFGGHLDGYTTPGWSQSIPRLYLQSLLEFTFPGAVNDQVNALSDDKTAGSWGNYRNITKGGPQQDGGFTARADGLLLYVPGFGKQGILVALGGGTNETFTQMNNLDIYDIASSSWYKQSTAGSYPGLRVNPCAVVAAAADGSSYNIYMFGGQNLTPYGNQTQYDDMWILTIPSFTWISVDQSKQSVPYGRSGHTCNIWDGQMVVVGGYTGAQLELSCESPGIYVYDLSNLQWIQNYTSRSISSSSAQADNDNPFSQQTAQLYNSSNPGGLEGSFGYKVPQSVIDVVGGGSEGGATLTTPVATATAGPLATGSPVTYPLASPTTYTITGSDGVPVATSTSYNTQASATPGSGSTSQGGGPNVGAIVAGVIAAVLFLIVCYLIFCTFVHRKQVNLYRNHLDMMQRQARGEKISAAAALLASNDRRFSKAPSLPNAAWIAGGENSSKHTSGQSRYEPARISGSTSDSNIDVGRQSFSSDELLDGREPTFVGVMLHPRRSLKVINRD